MQRKKESKYINKILVGAGVIWLFAWVYGFSNLLVYSSSPGEAGTTPSSWPKQSTLKLSPSSHTLMIFSHPKCPCSRATASELAKLMAKVEAHTPKTYVILYTPEDRNAEWTKTKLRELFETIPHTEIVLDKGGREAELFDVRTSGHALLYDSKGNILFRGGITPARGHEGDNLGKEAIISLINTGQSSQKESSVFGCAIRKPAGVGWRQD